MWIIILWSSYILCTVNMECTVVTLKYCTYRHKWAGLRKQQSSIIIYRLPTREKSYFCFMFLFAANRWKFAVSVFHLQQTNRSCHFSLVPFFLFWNAARIYIDIYGKQNYIDKYAAVSNRENRTWKARQYS